MERLHEPYKELKLGELIARIPILIKLHEPYKELKLNISWIKNDPMLKTLLLHEPYKELKLKLFERPSILEIFRELHEPYKELKRWRR